MLFKQLYIRKIDLGDTGMNIVFIAPPFKIGKDEWVTVPPKGYGGIPWVMKNIIDGLVERGFKVFLLGAPNSSVGNELVEVVDMGNIPEIEQWLKDNISKYDVIHDHSCRGIEFGTNIKYPTSCFKLHSHYLVTKPGERTNIVAASFAHAKSMNLENAPVVRHPVNPKNYLYSDKKESYLLYMGRVSRWKGTDLACLFARNVGIKLIIAGPAWERDYFDYIMNNYKNNIEYVGEVGGQSKNKLISSAMATLVFSNFVKGPKGKMWEEPGSQVVSESAICGTPVISSDNGCLKEIVPYVGKVIDNVKKLKSADCVNILSNLPQPSTVYENCYREWNYLKISEQYTDLYEQLLLGRSW
jgi:glycosyltransferase involved in cell wall biosynthesis